MYKYLFKTTDFRTIDDVVKTYDIKPDLHTEIP